MELAEEFYLSPESIKKIVYGKKIKLPGYFPTIQSAKQYSDAGVGEEWVRIYLENAGIELPDGSEFFLSELLKIPLRLIEDDNSADPEVVFVRNREYDYYLNNFGKQFQRGK